MFHGDRGDPPANPDAADLRLELSKISLDLQAGELRRLEPAPTSNSAGFVTAIREVLAASPKSAWPRLAISFNEDQVESKLWLLEHVSEAVDLSEHRVVILGAWYGLLALMMDRLIPSPPAEVVCIDIDEGVCQRARQLLSVLPVPPAVLRADMMELDYQELSARRPTVFVNTSCEHLPDFPGWRARVPAGARLVLQSNDHVGCPEHVSCVPDLAAFERQARLSAIDYKGTLRLKRFRRFMLVGRA